MKFDDIAKKFGITVNCYDELMSTNDLCKSSTFEQVTVVVAYSQTAGRGQRGNTWHSPKGQNLTFSIVMQPDFLNADMQFYISKIAALSVVNVLRTYELTAKIKWPNDIYIGDKKVCGILIENDILGMMMSRTIVGVGININQRDFDPALPNPTSMLNEMMSNKPAIIPIEYVLERFCSAFFKYYQLIYSADFVSIDAEYMQQLYRNDNCLHQYSNRSTGEIFQATVVGVERSGQLILKKPDGSQDSYSFGDISIVI